MNVIRITLSLSYEVNGPLLPTIELPSTKKECELLLNRLLYDPAS